MKSDDHGELLEKLLHAPKVMEAFGKVKSSKGDAIAEVTLTTSIMPRTAQGRNS